MAMMGLNDIFISVTPDKNIKEIKISLKKKKRKRKVIQFGNFQ